MNSNFSRYSVYIKPVIKNRYVKTYSSLVFSLIAITFFSLFALRPTFKTIISLQKDIQQQNQVLDQLVNKSKNLDTGINNYSNIDSQTLAKIDSLLPTKAAIVAFTNDISNIARVNQASISGIQYQPFEIDNKAKAPTKESDLKEISFSINLSGDYQTLINTLYSLSNSNHLIFFDNVNFTKSDPGLTMTIIGRTVY